MNSNNFTAISYPTTLTASISLKRSTKSQY